MSNLKSSTITIILSLLTSLAISQQIEIDIVHLTDGSIIKGTIIEHTPGGITKIETLTGRLFEFHTNEIQRITVEVVPDPKYQKADTPTSAIENDPVYHTPVTLQTRKPGSGATKADKKINRSFLGILNVGYSAPIEENNILKGGAYVSVLSGGFFFAGGLGIGFNLFGMANDFDLDLDLDPVTFVGISAGPIINIALSPNALVDLRPAIGTSRLEIVGQEYDQIVYSGGLSLRFGLSKRLGFALSGDYFRAPITATGEPDDIIQYVSASAGLVIML